MYRYLYWYCGGEEIPFMWAGSAHGGARFADDHSMLIKTLSGNENRVPDSGQRIPFPLSKS